MPKVCLKYSSGNIFVIACFGLVLVYGSVKILISQAEIVPKIPHTPKRYIIGLKSARWAHIIAFYI